MHQNPGLNAREKLTFIVAKLPKIERSVHGLDSVRGGWLSQIRASHMMLSRAYCLCKGPRLPGVSTAQTVGLQMRRRRQEFVVIIWSDAQDKLSATAA